ncbi:probable low affinity copper uptake protein 2 isoform X2 [Solea solea]|nr:probable low affinity copper uptake protein 2 isoform X2 [Solea solea]
MTFGFSSSVMLLFDFWDVNGPVGMVLSVLVVTLLTVFYEVLKVWRVWLSSKSKLARPGAAAEPCHSDSSSALDRSQSESSVVTTETRTPDPNSRKRFLLLHGVQAVLHVLHVTLGYMLMLCVMSYNAWIFLGVIVGSALGYYISFPLLGVV